MVTKPYAKLNLQGSAAADLPSLTYLGEGVATYTVEEGKKFYCQTGR